MAQPDESEEGCFAPSRRGYVVTLADGVETCCVVISHSTGRTGSAWYGSRPECGDFSHFLGLVAIFAVHHKFGLFLAQLEVSGWYGC